MRHFLRFDPTLLIILLLVGGGVVIWWKFFGSLQAHEGDDYRRLVRLSGGDPELAERLIGLELKRIPTLTRHHAIRDAIQRLGRDRR